MSGTERSLLIFRAPRVMVASCFVWICVDLSVITLTAVYLVFTLKARCQMAFLGKFNK